MKKHGARTPILDCFCGFSTNNLHNSSRYPFWTWIFLSSEVITWKALIWFCHNNITYKIIKLDSARRKNVSLRKIKFRFCLGNYSCMMKITRKHYFVLSKLQMQQWERGLNFSYSENVELFLLNGFNHFSKRDYEYRF